MCVDSLVLPAVPIGQGCTIALQFPAFPIDEDEDLVREYGQQVTDFFAVVAVGIGIAPQLEEELLAESVEEPLSRGLACRFLDSHKELPVSGRVLTVK